MHSSINFCKVLNLFSKQEFFSNVDILAYLRFDWCVVQHFGRKAFGPSHYFRWLFAEAKVYVETPRNTDHFLLNILSSHFFTIITYHFFVDKPALIIQQMLQRNIHLDLQHSKNPSDFQFHLAMALSVILSRTCLKDSSKGPILALQVSTFCRNKELYLVALSGILYK